VGGNIAFFCYSGKAIGKVDKLKRDEKRRKPCNAFTKHYFL